MANTIERICIVGGGPAGLSAAMYLEKKGYTDYDIYEKDNRVGGKCSSPNVTMTEDGKEVRSIEMGAIMGAKTYHAVHECELYAGVDHDGPALGREYKNKYGKVIYPFEPKKNILNGKIFGFIKMKKAVKKLTKLMKTKYAGYAL